MSLQMALRTSVAAVFVGGCMALFPAFAPVASADELQSAGVAEEARAAMSRMSRTLQATQFSFNARTLRTYVGPNGQLLHVAHAIKTVFRRPDRLRVDVTGDDGSTQMLFDGKAIVLYGVEQKKYSRLPVSGNNLDNALEVVEERTGTDFPLADLLSNDPQRSLLSGVTSGGEVDTAVIDGTPCRHFFLSQGADDLDFELWLEDNDQSLPRRLVVTYRSLPGRPNFLAELSNWSFSIQAPDSDFEFKPPVGVAESDVQPKSSGSSEPPK
jgi:hypothetical protein